VSLNRRGNLGAFALSFFLHESGSNAKIIDEKKKNRRIEI
jgi:hypothetical protein